MVVCISLQRVRVHDHIAFNDSGMLSFVAHDWRSVQIDLVVHNEKWIVVVDNIIVDAHTVKVLLEKVLEEEVLLFKSRLLLLNRKLVKVNLVEAFVEVVQHLELVLSV